jgi:hypothetical protein
MGERHTRRLLCLYSSRQKILRARYWPVDQFHLPGMRHERSNNLTHRIEVCDIVSIWPEPKIICSRRIRPRAGGADATLSCGKQTEQLAHNGPL